ncbi:MAG: hypothetical protein GY718_07135 [Lentisphaerae bacterium]|nr:hypothetical protein [Lentisphaerota bacterium]
MSYVTKPPQGWDVILILMVILVVLFGILGMCFIKPAQGEPIDYSYSAQYIPPHIKITNEVIRSSNLVLIPANLAFNVNNYLPKKGVIPSVNGVTSIADYLLYGKDYLYSKDFCGLGWDK